MNRNEREMLIDDIVHVILSRLKEINLNITKEKIDDENFKNKLGDIIDKCYEYSYDEGYNDGIEIMDP